MKGFSIPSISIPSISPLNISFNGSNVNTESIRNTIESKLPDLGSLTDGINLKGIASDLLSENISDSIDLTSDLSKMMPK